MEDYENRFIAQEKQINELKSAAKQSKEDASSLIRTLENEKQGLMQANKKISKEVGRLMCVDTKLQSREKEIKDYKLEICKAAEELQTKELMVSVISNTVALAFSCVLQHFGIVVVLILLLLYTVDLLFFIFRNYIYKAEEI